MEEKTMGSDVKITLPRDAEGREIPLDTKVLYDADGNELRVKCVEFDPFDENWRFILKADSSIWFDARYPRYSYLEKPTPLDSWEKLLEDLDNASKGGDNAECCYARRESVEVGSQCYGCRLFKNDDDSPECSYLVFADIAARIRRLRGED